MFAGISNNPPQVEAGPVRRIEIEWAMGYVRNIRSDYYLSVSYGKRMGGIITALNGGDLLDDDGIRHAWDGTFENAVELIIRAGFDIIY